MEILLYVKRELKRLQDNSKWTQDAVNRINKLLRGETERKIEQYLSITYFYTTVNE